MKFWIRILLAGIAALWAGLSVGVSPAAPPAPAPEGNVLIVHSGERHFLLAIDGLRDELGNDFKIREISPKKEMTVQTLEREISSFAPHVIILLDNKAISLFCDYQQRFPEKGAAVPVIAMLAVNVEHAVKSLKNSLGIAFEVPIVTSIVHFRSVYNRPVRRVGVVYRDFMEEFIRDNEAICRRENVEIVPVRLPNEGVDFKKETQQALARLMDKEKVDVLWLSNDNALLSADIIQNVWLPMAASHDIPLIVSVASFIDPKLNFGTFAVLPDLTAMGHQAAEIVFTLKAQHWEAGQSRTIPPVSVYTIVDFEQITKKFGVPEEKLDTVDKTVK